MAQLLLFYILDVSPNSFIKVYPSSMVVRAYIDFDPSQFEWFALFDGQKGRGSDRYIAYYNHRGYGFFSSFYKLLIPILKSVGKEVGKEALATGAKTLADVVEGKKLKESAIARSKEGMHHLMTKGAQATGGGKKKKRIIIRPTPPKRRQVGVYKL